MSSGLENLDSVDLVSQTKAGEVELTIVEAGPWRGSEEQLDRLRHKLNTYCEFFTGGQFARTYPQLIGRTARIMLRTFSPPDERTLELLEHISPELERHGLDLEVTVIRPRPGLNPKSIAGRLQALFRRVLKRV